MKKFTILTSTLVLFFAVANAQLNNPVKWTYSAKKVSDKTYELYISAILDDKWHIYSQDAGEGSMQTNVSFTTNPLVKLDGKVKELGDLEKIYDPNLRLVLKYYSKQEDFIQKLKLRSSAITMVKGKVTYIVCNDRKCLPQSEIPFSIKVDGK